MEIATPGERTQRTWRYLRFLLPRRSSETTRSRRSTGSPMRIRSRLGLPERRFGSRTPLRSAREVGSEEVRYRASWSSLARPMASCTTRTADGMSAVCSLGPQGWVRGRSPEGLFERARSMTLQVGPGLAVSATEAKGGTAHRALSQFDQNSRFLIDTIGSSVLSR